MAQLTIHLADDRGFVNAASAREAFWRVLSRLAVARNNNLSDNQRALKDLLESVVRKALRLIGKFEVQLAADAACLRLYSAVGLSAANDASEEFRRAFARAGVEHHYEWRHSWRQERRGQPFVHVSMESDLRKQDNDLTRKFGDMTVAEVKKLADAGDWTAREAMESLALHTIPAQIDHHFATFGIEETYRRLGFSYPSGEPLDAESTAPADEAAR